LQLEVYKTRIADLDELKQRLRREWVKLDHVVIAAAIGVVDSSRFCTPFSQYKSHAVIDWTQIWRIWRPRTSEVGEILEFLSVTTQW